MLHLIDYIMLSSCVLLLMAYVASKRFVRIHWVIYALLGLLFLAVFPALSIGHATPFYKPNELHDGLELLFLWLYFPIYWMFGVVVLTSLWLLSVWKMKPTGTTEKTQAGLITIAIFIAILTFTLSA